MVGCFDLTRYNFKAYTLNWLVTAFLVGKNFLTDDRFLSNNMGAICLVGAPGSGKSRIASIL